jgi:sugar lactone lactonase YvrE
MHRQIRAIAVVLSIIAVASCGESPTGPGLPYVPSWEISDGAHMHGNPHFYFLPPMVPQPAYRGTPDASLAPTVLVCEFTSGCDKVIARFTTTSGTGSELVRYDAASQQYIVNWHTDACLDGACSLDPAKTYRIRILVGVAELGFADVDVVGNGSQLRNVQTSEYIGLVNGKTLPVKFRIERGAVSVLPSGGDASVGSAGGMVSSSDGTVALAVPAGALASTTSITIAPSDSNPVGNQNIAPLIEFGPDGTTFTTPVTLTLAYNPAALPPNVPDTALSVITLRDGSWDVVPGSVVDAADHTVSAPVGHFSYYTVGITPTNAQWQVQPQVLTIGQSTILRAYVTSHTCMFSCWQQTMTNWWTYWSSSNGPVASPDITAIQTDASGYAATTWTGRLVGQTDIVAYTFPDHIHSVSSPPLHLTVIPSVRAIVSGLDVGMTPRSLGLQQYARLTLQLLSPPVLHPVIVSFSHQGPGIAGPTGTFEVQPGLNSVNFEMLGSAAGRDTVIFSAPGYGPDTTVFDVAPGLTSVENFPGRLTIGDSAAVTIRMKAPDGTAQDVVAGTVSVSLGGSPNLRFSDGRQSITSIVVPDHAARSALFYVVATGPGTGSVRASAGARFTDFNGSFPIAGQALVLQPRSLTTVAGWVFGDNIAVTTAMATDVDVSLHSLNALTIGEAGTGNYTYGGQTGTYTLRAGATSKQLSVFSLDGPSTDTLVASAPGMLPDSAFITLVQGRLRVDGWPTTLAYGDSAPLQATITDANGSPGSLAYPIDIALGGSGLAYSDGHQPITSVNIQQRTSGTFYAKAVAAGTGTMTLTHRDYVTYSNTVAVAPPPSVQASPYSQTITVAEGSVAQGTISITNGGGGTLAGMTVTGFSDYFVGGSYPWISASLSSPTAPATITITVAPPVGVPIQQYQVRFGLNTPTAASPDFAFYSIYVNVLAPVVTAQVAAGGKSSCEKKLDGTVFCWGETSHGATDAPASTQFSTISAGYFHYCGIRPDQALACWGYDSDLRAEPPSGSFTQLSVGPEDNCALRTDGTAACWGFSNDGRASVPSGTYAKVAMGWYHGCALKTDGSVVCWGLNDIGQANAPSGAFRDVEAGTNSSCGVRTDLTLTCWGAIGAPPTGQFISIGHPVGGGHMCAIRIDHTLACWGQNDFGQAVAPNGTFAQVSEGGWHSCGVRTDGSSICWGSDATGAVTIVQPTRPLYASNQDGNRVTVFAPGGNGDVTPVTMIEGASTGLNAPQGIAHDAAGNLYVANSGSNAIIVFAPGASGDASPIRMIAGGNTQLSGLEGLAVDAGGSVYVADQVNSRILVFGPGANGDVTPARTIEGPGTGLYRPIGIALDGSGRLHVVNLGAYTPGTNSITVYSAGASGNAAPIATIAGGSTGLYNPLGIALDAAGNIYVSNFGNTDDGPANFATAVNVFAAGSTGNASPIRTIMGSMSEPEGLAVDPSGRLYVANFDGQFIAVFPAGASGGAAPSALLSGANTGINRPTFLTF